MVKITELEEGSLAHKAGVRVGDVLVSINGNAIKDVLDYRFYLAERGVELLLDRGGEKYSVKIKKGEYDDIGLDFETPLMDKKQSCRNACIFCFIDQNPEGLRDSLYFKDDDSRLSFLHGNYITLTNMDENDIARIIKMRISPVNISIHTTNPELRVKMMKNKRSGEVLKYLDDFKNAGLHMCGQIVLCRGVNDKDELRRTLSDLTEYYPYLTSVSVVPAGLTKHRDGLYPLSDFTKEEALEVIDTVNEFGAKSVERHGCRLFYAADEFYLKAGLDIPDADYYEEYPQIENGVGMLRSTSDEFEMALEDLDLIDPGLDSVRRVTVVTGAAAYPMLKDFAERIMARCDKLDVRVKKIVNSFFGESITVSGLLTGQDIISQLEGEELGDELLIPKAALKHEEELFLDGVTVSEMSERLGVPVRAQDADGYAFVESLFGV
ncbi:MAG: DUF512 domain-containing protein [Clostridia bacterium]|nr:DUF512 domain-containing protein [Clostridia bacterium]